MNLSQLASHLRVKKRGVISGDHVSVIPSHARFQPNQLERSMEPSQVPVIGGTVSHPKATKRMVPYSVSDDRHTGGPRHDFSQGALQTQPQTERKPRARIMIVDDHAGVREGLAILLGQDEQLDLVAEAIDGIHAIDLIDRARPDLILMDINLPRLNGVEATRRIKQNHPGIKIIALSMHDRADLGDAMEKAGACDYIAKHEAGSKLLESIHRALGQG